MRTLVAWLGHTDLRAASGEPAAGLGPIAQAVAAREYESILLLSDHPREQTRSYARWLRARTPAVVEARQEALSSPVNFGEIYEAAVRALTALDPPAGRRDLTFHLSPGTPAMAAVWIILAKTRFPAELIESSKDHGVKTASVPFDISADFIPDLMRRPDERLGQLSEGHPPAAPEFAAIVHRCGAMVRLISRARRAAARSIPVLIEGESGTGKELLARAIHTASPRRGQPFVTVNCGAIPAELVEAELFGHEKGAFTGAVQARRGYFEEASGGTLFLDEVGELPAAAQVKLLRTLQQGEVVRVGSAKALAVDVRIVAATNRTLVEEVAAGRFREDLFYRLAVAVLRVPALRERHDDVGLLVDRLWQQVNEESREEPGYKEKRLAPGARSLLMRHPWPGNVRELLNTLRRVAVWSDGLVVHADDARDALLPATSSPGKDILDRPLGHGLALPELLSEVARHYLARAMREANGNKTKAAELIGLPSYQTLTNWLSRHQIDVGNEPA